MGLQKQVAKTTNTKYRREGCSAGWNFCLTNSVRNFVRNLFGVFKDLHCQKRQKKRRKRQKKRQKRLQRRA